MATRRLKLLTTGGTIATVQDAATGETRAARSGEELLASLSAEGNAADPFDIDVEALALTASWRLTPGDMQRIALRARDVARSDDYAGVVVTHGTQTLEYTAFFTDLILDAQAPVVFTGAMLPASAENSDGPRNLRHALQLAGSDECPRQGAVVCFAGKTIPARAAWKWSRSEPEAFVSTGGSARRERGRVLSGEIEPRVGIVKAYPGGGGEAVHALVAGGVRGLVVEGLPGQGGVPVEMHEAIRSAASKIPVVLSSRAPAGRLARHPSGGTGDPLRGFSLISAGELTTEKAWILLMLTLGETNKLAEVEAIFDEIASPKEEE